MTNSLWGQRGYTFLTSYLDLLAERYGAGLSLLDFSGDPEGSRASINGWVSERTKTRIPELIPAGVVTRATVLVLTNAIYFKASWKHPFEPSATKDGPFTKPDGSIATAHFMNQTKEHRYVETEDCQAVELLYAGDDVSMLVLAPTPGKYESFVASFDEDLAQACIEQSRVADGERSTCSLCPRFTLCRQVVTRTARVQVKPFQNFGVTRGSRRARARSKRCTCGKFGS